MRSAAAAIFVLFGLAACAHRESHVAATSPGEAPRPAVAALTLIPAEANRDITAHPAGAYRLDPRHTSVTWRVRHAGLGLFVGRFDDVSGTLQFDPTQPEASRAKIRIGANSVAGRVQEADFFQEIAETVLDAGKHPEIVFETDGARKTGQTSGEVTGTLTIRGLPQPVAMRVEFEGGKGSLVQGGHVLAFNGLMLIDRTAFGARFPNPVKNAFVGEDVEILVSAEFVKE